MEGSWCSDSKPIYKYEIIERNHHFQSEFWGGFSRHNQLYRRRYKKEDVLIDEEYITENHALMMYSPFLDSSN